MPVARNLGAAPCSSVTPWRLMDQNHISGVLEHNAHFLPPTHIYPCRLPIVNVQLRLQIKGRNTDKKRVLKKAKYDICIFGTRGE